MVNFKELEAKVVTAAKDILHEAEAAEPTIGAAVQTALEGAGVPAPLAGTAVTLVEGLLAHFINDHPHATTPVEEPPAPAPVAPVAEPAPAPTPTAPVAPSEEAAAPADPFAPAVTEPATTA
jgi:hypothetical protein